MYLTISLVEDYHINKPYFLEEKEYGSGVRLWNYVTTQPTSFYSKAPEKTCYPWYIFTTQYNQKL